jgi:hypothetical protein
MNIIEFFRSMFSSNPMVLARYELRASEREVLIALSDRDAAAAKIKYYGAKIKRLRTYVEENK